MVQLPKLQVSKAEIKILRWARKKKFISIRDVDFWTCESLMKRGAFDKYVPDKGKGAGWPHYRITRKARKLLEYADARHRAPARRKAS